MDADQNLGKDMLYVPGQLSSLFPSIEETRGDPPVFQKCTSAARLRVSDLS